MNTPLSNQKGITLLEVMIALVLSGIALLGLAAAELRSLQYATNSFNYTISTIQANNAVERTWVNLCNLQNAALPYDNVYSNNFFAPQVNLYTVGVIPDPTAAQAFNNTLSVTVSWNDSRIGAGVNNDNALNSVAISATFPQIC